MPNSYTRTTPAGQDYSKIGEDSQFNMVNRPPSPILLAMVALDRKEKLRSREHSPTRSSPLKTD